MSRSRLSLVARLAWILLRGSSTLADGGGDSGKKSRKIGMVVLILFLIVYFGAFLSGGVYLLHSILAPFGMQSMMIGLLISAGLFLAFFFGVLQVITTLYHAQDVERLLPLPLRGREIIGAKMVVNFLYEYLEMLAIVIVPLLVYGIINGEPARFFLVLPAVLILLPVFPLALAAVLVILLMRFTRFARNKDRFTMIIQLLAFAVAMAFSFGMQFVVRVDPEQIVDAMRQGGQALVRLTTSYIPGAAWAVGALTSPDAVSALGQLALLALLAVAVLVLLIVVAERLYFAGAVGLSQGTPGTSHRLSGAELRQSTGRLRGSLVAILLKDWRILLRTPIFFMNCVLMNFIWPVFLLMPFLMNQGSGADTGSMLESIRQAFRDGEPSAMVITWAAFFGATAFFAATNGIAASALSREGRLLYVMKMVPVPYWTQLVAKLTLGILLAAVGPLLIIILIAVVFNASPLLILSTLALLPAALIIPNLAGLWFDLLWPKLDWDNEQKAVKQNLNVLFQMLVGIILGVTAALPALLLYFLAGWSPWATWALLLALSSALTVVSWMLLSRRGPRRLREIAA